MSTKPNSNPPRVAYLVLGMHRSGTSAVTQLLALAGASLPANVMPGDEHNAKGYFEPWKIAMLNDERLRAGGSAWDDVFAFPFRPLPDAEERAWIERAGGLFDEEYSTARFPLMKDPRATVLLPLWRTILDERGIEARAVVPVRHPLAVAASLSRRDGFSREKSVLLWSAYMLAAEAHARDLPCAFVGYDALLSDWRSEASRIEAAHGAALPKLSQAAGRRIDQFLTPDLRHNESGAESDLAALGWAGEIAQGVFDWCEAKAAGGDPDRAALETAASRLADRAAEVGPLVSPAARDLADARAQLLETRQRLQAERLYRDQLEAQLRTDQRRLNEALILLDQVNAELDRALD